MRFGPKRGHFLLIFQNLFKDFGLLIIFLTIGVIIRDFSLLLDNIIIVAVVFITPVSRVLEFLTTYFSVDQEFLIIDSGVVVKKKTKIPIKSITNIDTAQSIIMQLANVYTIIIDNSAQVVNGKGKIRIVLNASDCKILKELLLHNTEEPIESEVLYNVKMKKAGTKDILMLGLLQSNFLMILQVFSFFAAGIPILNAIFKDIKINENAIALDIINNINGILIAIILILFLALVGTVISIIVNSIKYMGFQISDRNESINIEYGLFNKKQHSIVKKKICGISYKQPLLMGMMKTGYLEVIAIGYGGVSDDTVESSTSFLFPLIKKDELDEFINEWVPGLFYSEKIAQCSKAPFRYFLPSMSVFFSTIVLFLSIIYSKTINAMSENVIESFSSIVISICALYFVVSIISIVIERRTNGIGGDERIVKVVSGGINITTSLVYTKNIEYALEKGSVFKRKNDCSNISFGIFGPSSRNNFKVRNMSLLSYKRLKEVLKY